MFIWSEFWDSAEKALYWVRQQERYSVAESGADNELLVERDLPIWTQLAKTQLQVYC